MKIKVHYVPRVNRNRWVAALIGPAGIVATSMPQSNRDSAFLAGAAVQRIILKQA